MIIYNVTVSVDTAIAGDWISWMLEEHMPALVQTGCFSGYRLNHLLEQDEAEHKTYVAQYEAPDRAAYEHYIANHAAAMREAGLKKFGNRFHAFRTIMERLA